MNNQGKRKDQEEFSSQMVMGALGGIIGILVFCIIVALFTGCTATYYVSDAEYDDAKEEHLAITYHNDLVYWGWHKGWWYYYGKPHYYPWYYYYDVCPPSYYNPITHIIVHTLVNKPTHRPIIIYKPNRPNRPYKPRPNINKKPNRNKVIIKNGSKRTNKKTIRRR